MISSEDRNIRLSNKIIALINKELKLHVCPVNTLYSLLLAMVALMDTAPMDTAPQSFRDLRWAVEKTIEDMNQFTS